jgi:hypothetical protein
MAEEQMLTAADIAQAHNCPGGDSWLIANGYKEHLDKYLEAVVEGRSWDPNDMSNVPLTPVSSKLHQGMRKTADVNLPDPDDDEEDEDVPPYEEWSHDDLVGELEARKLSTEGDDETLVLRLMEDDSAGETEPPVQVDYSAFKKAELQQICEQRGLPNEGTVKELIDRLQTDDRERQSD